jgi:hypothetical protein
MISSGDFLLIAILILLLVPVVGVPTFFYVLRRAFTAERPPNLPEEEEESRTPDANDPDQW